MNYLVLGLIGGASFVMIIFLVILLRKLQRTIAVQDVKNDTSSLDYKAPQESLIQKQNEQYKEWADTTATRDKLKLLKISAAAEES